MFIYYKVTSLSIIQGQGKLYLFTNYCTTVQKGQYQKLKYENPCQRTMRSMDEGFVQILKRGPTIFILKNRRIRFN
jgi:hypothetical protein